MISYPSNAVKVLGTFDPIRARFRVIGGISSACHTFFLNRCLSEVEMWR
jgi:hypothetical protein